MKVRGLGKVFAVAVSAMMLVLTGTQPSWAWTGYHYAGYWGTAYGAYGIDGYIRSSGSVAPSSGDHKSSWINVCESGCADWVQMGAYQGAMGKGGVGISDYVNYRVHMFIENSNSTCGSYFIQDTGEPPQADTQYMLTWVWSGNYTCPDGTTHWLAEYRFSHATISNGTIIDGYMFMHDGAGQPIANMELYSGSGNNVPHGTDYFGLDPNQAVNAGYGLHIQTTANGSWPLWDGSSDGGSSGAGNNPPALTQIEDFWAFSAY